METSSLGCKKSIQHLSQKQTGSDTVNCHKCTIIPQFLKGQNTTLTTYILQLSLGAEEIGHSQKPTEAGGLYCPRSLFTARPNTEK